MDDCLSSKGTWMRDQPIQELLYNGRHYKIMYILTMQYPLGIPPTLRTNVDYVFILREPYIANRKRIFDNYAGMFPTFEAFCHMLFEVIIHVWPKIALCDLFHFLAPSCPTMRSTCADVITLCLRLYGT